MNNAGKAHPSTTRNARCACAALLCGLSCAVVVSTQAAGAAAGAAGPSRATLTAPNAAVPSGAISSITLERGCFGCSDSGLLVLRRDGAATHTKPGNARQGTVDQIQQGRIAPADFERLAQLLVAQGFFALQDNYENPTLRDGAWVRIAVTTGAAAGAGGPPGGGQQTAEERVTQVFSRESAGPAQLQRMVAAIDAAKTRTRFGP